MRHCIAWSVAAMVLMMGTLVVPGCGYQLEGGGLIHDDISRVSVAIFKNRSSQSEAGIFFTNELIREITAKTDTVVVGSGVATRKITGTIHSITFSTLARSSSQNVTERQVRAKVDVVLKGGDGKILWSVKNFTATESYMVSSNSVNDEANKRDAVDLIAERVAERLVSQMTNNF